MAVAESNKGKTLIKCENCGIDFWCQNFRITKHKHLFCSKKCEGEYRKNKTPLNCVCDYCGKLFHRKESQIKRNVKWNVCSQQCNIEIRKIMMAGKNNHQYNLKGELNASWKSNERISSYGYRLIRSLDHPFKNCDGFVFEHRLIAEKYLLTDDISIEIDNQKYLSPDYVVHHIDFDRLNNSPENLKIMKLNDHTLFHILHKQWENGQINIESDQYRKYKELINKYDIQQYFVTEDDDTDGIRNGGFGSTTKVSG